MMWRKIIIYLENVKLSLSPVLAAYILMGKDKLTNKVISGLSKKMKETNRVESVFRVEMVGNLNRMMQENFSRRNI